MKFPDWPSEWEFGRAYLAGEEARKAYHINNLGERMAFYRCKFPHVADNGNMPGWSDEYWYKIGEMMQETKTIGSVFEKEPRVYPTIKDNPTFELSDEPLP